MRRLFFICCSLFVAVGAHAQLTPATCRQLAREHYPEVRRYDLIRLATEYTVSNARRAYLPQFVLSTQATWQTAVPSYPDVLTDLLTLQGIEMEGLSRDQYKIQLELSQTIWDGGKTRADRLAAEAEETEALRSVDVDLYALEGRVDELYFGILLLEERIAQMELTIELLRSSLEKVQALQRSGVAMQSDADAVEAELLSVGQQLDGVETVRESYRRMLSLFVGKELGDERLERPVELQLHTGEVNRPELALLDARQGTLAAREKLVRSSVMPRIGLFAQGYYGYPGLDFLESMVDRQWTWNALVGVRMSWNFGAYYTQRNSLNKLRNARQQLEVQRDVFLFNNRLQAAQESGEIARLRRALADDDRIVALRRSVREAAESKLRNGVIDTNDLLKTITEEDAAAAARSAREIELLKAIYELNHTIGQ